MVNPRHTRQTGLLQDGSAEQQPAAPPVGSRSLFWWVGAGLGIALLTVGAVVRGGGNQTGKPGPTAPPAKDAMPIFAVVINRPAGAPQVATGMTHFQGQPVMASCASCHSTTIPDLETRSSEQLDKFHQGLKYAHGNLTCLSCHNDKNYEALRLADTRSVEFSDSMTLCSQCHGPQRRDYDRGLHGGMNGHWDLTRGGRTRNTCVDCHDAHSPAFPEVMPVLAPRDRISVPPKTSPAGGKTASAH